MTPCRVCGGSNFLKVFSFGPTPPANAFLREDQLSAPEPMYPLDAYFCTSCSFVQLGEFVSPEVLFRNYVYTSSTSPLFVAHFERFADAATNRFQLNRESFVVDIGSNDGILLRPFRARGTRVLGVDPAREIAQRASEDGIPTIPEFFSPEVAVNIVRDHGQARLVTGTNVFAHVEDLDSAVSGVTILLKDDGVFIVEVQYLADLLEKNLFDNVYHEHVYYWRVGTIRAYLRRVGMEVFDVERISTHGGSIRVFAQKMGAGRPGAESVARLIREEEDRNLHDRAPYIAFARAVERNREATRTLVGHLRAAGKTIAGYGAPAKSTTLLHYFGIGRETIDCIADDSIYKQGLYTPGTHIPVVSPRVLTERRPDYVLILAWNFADDIMKKLKPLAELGTRFIIPVPEPRIV